MGRVIEFEKVSIVFGADPERALPLMDQGRSRAEIQAATGQILGVHDCSLTVNEGEISVLMGLSGSGKSTLLRAVNGLNTVTRGSLKVRGRDGTMVDVVSCPPAQLRAIRRGTVSMVFQQFALLPWRTVIENVALGLELAGMSHAERLEKARGVLSTVGLEDWGEKRVSELSGGMQQRVGLARAFATDAGILLMDEPFSALDPLIRSRLQDELLELQTKMQCTIVFVSHDLEEAVKIGNTITIMEGGRIVQTGRPEDIVLRPANGYVADFVAQLNPLSVLRAVDVMGPVDGPADPARSVAPETALREALPLFAAESAPVWVIEGDRTLGAVTPQAVFGALCPRR
ncbi:MAG TPA: choline ABC transporter ATP-binding protein [Amaricoccus sp.]|uniref:choline ABC transporter ATP-binding protein n=1 Tax=Amaricoccus sp. TaxID=1872485 RepID=UPI002C248A89|nr:choline ABC transporter ATP-binding protein [Amaricoccus sp.]HMQ91862.1 choline ABC transporter ATP-binding protein [Amaricoccus sp.]HMR53415.1 choline ABC transporter ATP-binding protein [Amaricoccus sp.]HMR60554.1 choline ABC transporter ATP-binding protein [Amaricoccus sp.]HMU00388.1 choline ABC transporter ATP-binding protein [Amaricoccus sp.]